MNLIHLSGKRVFKIVLFVCKSVGFLFLRRYYILNLLYRLLVKKKILYFRYHSPLCN